jgi:membrane protein implicated in regulation of membrane protease activity
MTQPDPPSPLPALPDSDIDVQLFLEEMRSYTQQTLNASTVLDHRANFVIALIAAVVTYLATVIIPGISLPLPLEEAALLTAAIFLLLVSFTATLIAFAPGTYQFSPIIAQWEEFDRRLARRDRRDAVKVIISGHLAAIEQNNRNNLKKSRLHRLSAIALFLSVICLVAVQYLLFH